MVDVVEGHEIGNTPTPHTRRHEINDLAMSMSPTSFPSPSIQSTSNNAVGEAPSDAEGAPVPTAASLENTTFPSDGEAQLFDHHPNDAEGAAAPSESLFGSPTAAAASLSNPSSVNNSDGPDKNVEGWFYRHALPFSDGVKISLDDWGVYCVEQLKLLPSDVFLGMFEHDKLIVRETAVSLKKFAPSFSFVTSPFVHILLC